MIDVVDKARQGILDPALKRALADETRAKKGYVYCATCSHVVSHIDHRLEVAGTHEHHFVNPHGFHFDVACYREALGCIVSGSPQAADTWFAGYHWRHAQCEECRMHLGWFFANADNHGFFGLIVDKIQTD